MTLFLTGLEVRAFPDSVRPLPQCNVRGVAPLPSFEQELMPVRVHKIVRVVEGGARTEAVTPHMGNEINGKWMRRALGTHLELVFVHTLKWRCHL